MAAAQDPLGRLRSAVQAELTTFLADQRGVLAGIGPELDAVADALEAFLLDGGKRLRPAFCWAGWLGAGQGSVDEETAVRAAAALELLQACALIHDDVMDGSDTRRGQPAVHRRFQALHVEAGWRGTGETFGAGAAILLGDLCLIWADRLLDASGVGPDVLTRARPVYDEMRVQLMAGQYLDLYEQTSSGRSLERALRVARFKTAGYTIEKPLQLGRLLAGGDALLGEVYSAYGLPLGAAFQLRDDVLGVFGDPAATGKPAGDDLREGKRTALVALAFAGASAAQAELLESSLGDPALDDGAVDAVRDVIEQTGALAEVERLIEQRTHEALHAIGSDLVAAPAQAVLRGLAAAATARAA